MDGGGVPIVSWDNITLLEKVGEGGFSDVYKGVFRDQTVCVKQWRYQEIPPDQLQLFQREVQIGSMIRHPNCCQLIAICMQPISLILEFVEGFDLYDLIHNANFHMTWGVARQMAYDIALGLQHLHSQQIIHRDLKSPNFLVDRNTLRVKVCDFGLSRLKETTLKMTGGRGTVHWMAPEVIQHQNYTEKADVYSYGICLWELIARDLPFSDIFRNHIGVAESVVLKGRRPEIPDGVPPLVVQLIKQCWAQDPQMRPTMDSVLRAFDHPMLIPSELLNTPIPCRSIPGFAPHSNQLL